MKVLLSIRPEYVSRIFSGEKRYEFRRCIFKEPSVDEIYIYETAPVKRIVGKFSIKEVHKDSPDIVWLKTSKHAGIDKKSFFEYFNGKDTAYAIEINQVVRFSSPINPWEKNKNFIPPQSFTYIDERVITG